MTHKIEQLQGLIREALDPLVTTDYVYLDLPYHGNIGDSLIWQGTLDYLHAKPYKCLYAASYTTFDPSRVPPGALILLHGGGNFGDLWLSHQRFRMKVVDLFPTHRIVLLPQSIHYTDLQNMQRDAEAFARHPDVTLCLRDHSSLQIAETHFPSCRTLLVPDMAFCIDMKRWMRFARPVSKETLFIERLDKEKAATSYDLVPPDADRRDWPTLEPTRFTRFIDRVLRRLQRCPRAADFIYCHILRKSYIKTGIRLISPYRSVYTTRLHVAILSVLLHKDFTFFDNSYGKNSSFYDAWLADVGGITFIRNHD